MTARHALNRTAFGIVAILMACSGGCYDEGDSLTEDLASDPGAGEEVFGADESKIYFKSQGQIWTMNSDGSGKAALPAGVSGEPSVSLHGGNRWFVRKQQILGETYPGGGTRVALFAVRGDGDAAFTVQLTTQADLQLLELGVQAIMWKPGDAAISWIARRWSGGSVVEGGIYSAEIVFDAGGNVTGLAAQPSGPAVTVALTWNNGTQPNVGSFDWSPDGSQVVHSSLSGGIRIANLTGSSQVLVQGGNDQPRWSPNGSKIAYRNTGNFRIYTISPDGSGAKAVTSPGNKYDGNPIWSPPGTHFIFTRGTSITAGGVSDIYRVAVGSPQITNLTGDLAESAGTFAWR